MTKKHSHKKRQTKNVFLILFMVVAGIVVFGGYLFTRTQPGEPIKPPDFTKVAAVSGTTIVLSIKSDSVGPYLEYNGTRLSSSNMLEGVKTNAEYTLEITNTTSNVAGVFIPSKEVSVLIDPGQTDSSSRITFNQPGTFTLLPNVYLPGWDQMMTGFVVTD